ncbi:MAG: AAA family ATPase [Gammaproteobacteria bacterium]
MYDEAAARQGAEFADEANKARELFHWKPFVWEELRTLPLCPPAIVDEYRDVAVFAAQGGSNKTTLQLWECVHVVLGRPLYGLRTSPGRILYVTGEDSADLLGATLRELMLALNLSDADRDRCLENIGVLDVWGKNFRLCELDRGGNACTTNDVDFFIDAYGDLGLGLIIFDPLVSFGAPETAVNVAAQGAINAARRICRELGCGVRLIHHVSQEAARNGTRDQYSPRGGSALSDGARMIAVLSRPSDTEPPPFPVSVDEQVIVLSRPKVRYARAGLPDIYIKRKGFEFAYQTDIPKTPEEEARTIQNQVHQFLVDQLCQGRKYTLFLLEGVLPVLKLTRRQVREAIAALRVSGRIVDRELPKEKQQGVRKTFLYPVPIPPNSPDPSAEYTSYPQDDASIPPDISIPPPPIGKQERRNSPPSCFPSDPGIPPKCTAEYGGIGGIAATSQPNDLISRACAGVIDPEVFRSNLTPEDLADIEAGRVDVAYLRCAVESMVKKLNLSERNVGPLGDQVNESHDREKP